MKVLAVVPNLCDTSPGQRFRLEQWEALLRQMGVEITYHAFENEALHKIMHKSGQAREKIWEITKAFYRRAVLMNRVKDFDLIYLFREAALFGPAFFEKWMRQKKIPIVFDFDDAIFVPYVSPTNGYLSYLKFPGKTASICRLSSWVTVGNEHLANYVRQHNRNVSVIPTTIDTDKYLPKSVYHKEKVVIGWSGSFSTVQHLDTIREVFRKLAKERNFVLKVIGTPKYELDGVEVNALPWRAETEVEDLSEIDIGVMPLPDDKWSKGKCGLKALQYMALGTPTICSPVGVNTKIIQDGENGFIADGLEEWVEKLKLLLDSAELREKLGKAGRQTVEREYSAKVIAPKVYDLFSQIVSFKD